MDRTRLIQLVKEKFESNSELQKYLPYLETVKISNATLEVFLVNGTKYIKRYFFWVPDDEVKNE